MCNRSVRPPPCPARRRGAEHHAASAAPLHHTGSLPPARPPGPRSQARPSSVHAAAGASAGGQRRSQPPSEHSDRGFVAFWGSLFSIATGEASARGVPMPTTRPPHAPTSRLQASSMLSIRTDTSGNTSFRRSGSGSRRPTSLRASWPHARPRCYADLTSSCRLMLVSSCVAGWHDPGRLHATPCSPSAMVSQPVLPWQLDPEPRIEGKARWFRCAHPNQPNRNLGE